MAISNFISFEIYTATLYTITIHVVSSLEDSNKEIMTYHVF